MHLYKEHSKGVEKYANLYLSWLNYISSFTCKSHSTLKSLCWRMILLNKQDAPVQLQTQRTVIACILHCVQDGLQSQIANILESRLPEVGSSTTSHDHSCSYAADDTGLYRISGWALIDVTDNHLKQSSNKPDIKRQLDLLHSLKRADSKTDNTLPLGVQYLNRGGLTFMHAALLPWLQSVESSITKYLNQSGYQQYGKDIFSVSI